MSKPYLKKQTKPVFTQKMTMHLNGGDKFSELHYAILRDGKQTRISRFTATNGCPQYKITRDIFFCGEDEFDVMNAPGGTLQQWLEVHSTA